MKLQILLASSLAFTVLALSPIAHAADQPSVDSILDKYVAALGGKDAKEKIKTRVTKLKFESESMPASDGQIMAKLPNKQYLSLELSGVGTLEDAFDGAVAWVKSPWEGLRTKTGDELAKARRDSEFHRDLKLKTLYPGLAVKGTEKVGDEDAYVLESKPTPTSKERLLFSSKSGLMLRQESELEGPQGPVNTVVTIQQYQSVDGLKYPAQVRMKISSGGQVFEMTMKVLEVKHNVPVEDAKFAKPSA